MPISSGAAARSARPISPAMTSCSTATSSGASRSSGRWETIRVAPVLRTNNGEMLLAAAEAGLGLAMLPSFIAAPALERGTIDVLLLDFPIEEGALHAVMPPGRAVTARVRALVDFLVERFGPEPSWDPCWLAQEGAR